MQPFFVFLAYIKLQEFRYYKMKLALVKGFENVDNILTAIAIDEHKAVFLSYREEDMFYQLLYVSDEEYRVIELDYTEKYYQLDNHPVLFSINNRFGIVKSPREVLLYSDTKQGFESIYINNIEVLPQRFKLQWKVAITDNSLLPICFSGDGLGCDTRYIAFLELDIENKKARWESWTSLETNVLTHHSEDNYPPKIDSVMLKDNELYLFTSGGQITSVNKWGMDYYALTRGTQEGSIKEILIDSGNLHTIDHKKRGVNGLLSNSQKYVMLTPVFQSDEWKGKQKLYSLKQSEIMNITFPRGFGKYPQILEHYGDYFWVYLKEKRELAICREG